MAKICTPHWAPAGTYPTIKGWVTPSGEVIKKQKMTAEQIAEWMGPNAPSPKQTLHEAPVVETFVEPEIESFYYGEERDEHPQDFYED